MVQKRDTKKRRSRLGPIFGPRLAGLNILEGHLVNIWARARNGDDPEFWVNLLGFVILQLAIVIGWIAASGGRLNESWNSVLIAFASAALGFGAAYLLGRRSTDSQGLELERTYEDLRQRSTRLLGAIDKFERPSRPL